MHCSLCNYVNVSVFVCRYFNGNPLKIDNENIKLGTTPEGNHCLLIEKVTPENTGEYEIHAKNDIGDNSSKARLTVSCKDYFSSS